MEGERLRQEIEQMLAQAQSIDDEEDATWQKQLGDGVPGPIEAKRNPPGQAAASQRSESLKRVEERKRD